MAAMHALAWQQRLDMALVSVALVLVLAFRMMSVPVGNGNQKKTSVPPMTIPQELLNRLLAALQLKIQ